MIQQVFVLIVIFPLVFSFFVFIAGWRNEKLCFPLAILALSVCVIFSVIILKTVIENGPIHYWFGGWQPPWVTLIFKLNGLRFASHHRQIG